MAITMATPRATGKLPEPFREALAKTMNEARDLGHAQVGTSHLLVGILRVDQSMGANILRGMGLTLERAQEVEEFFREHPAQSAQRTIQQSLERIRLNVKWLESNRHGLADWFANGS